MRSSLGRGFIAAIAITAAITLSTGAVAYATSSSSISGSIFQDLNRDGARQADEAPFTNVQLYLFDSTGAYVATTIDDGSGNYLFSGLADGDYTVDFEYTAWQSIRRDWVPTTTGSLMPERSVHLVGTTAADFGWRPIVRSTTTGSPISSFTAPNGTRFESYDDVVAAHTVYDASTLLGLEGSEAPFVTVRFDLGAGDNTVTTAGKDGSGRYSTYSASVYLDYEYWLTTGDTHLDHEYGHAWSLYNAYITQQDPTFAGYLQVRGLIGDPRLDTSHAWSRREMIAEDFRQLFGSANARSSSQENADIPPASQVQGLKEYLQGAFMTAPSGGSGGTQPPLLTISNLSITPVPVRTSATVSFVLSTTAAVSVQILNSKGAIVKTIMSSSVSSGTVSASWDRTNSSGRKVGKGTYSVRVDASSGSQTASVNLSFTVS